MSLVKGYRYMVLRRLTQGSVLFLFFAGNALGWKVLRGNLSTSRLLDSVTLTDPFAVLQVLATGTLIAADALIGAMIVIVFFALVGGRAFCSWVCPMNAVTDFANWLRKKVVPEGTRKTLSLSRQARYWIIGLSLILSAFLGVAAFEWISPISMLHRGVIYGMGAGWAAVLAVFLFDLFVAKNGFCGHLCPLGGFYSLIGRVSLVRVQHDQNRCTQCMKCLEICPEGQVLPMVGKRTDMVLAGECTNCARCIEVCDDNAMRFGNRLSSKKTVMQGGGKMLGVTAKKLIAAGISVVFLLSAGTVMADEKKKKDKPMEEEGIRKATIYDENTVTPVHGEYSKAEPGKSKRIERAFENSPPLIPHDLTGMLPIAVTNNMCLSCHMPDVARSFGATATPKSHFVKMGTGKDLGKLDGERYNCMECHVPQVNIPEPIKNTFKADFRKKKDKTASSLIDSLNEGVKAE